MESRVQESIVDEMREKQNENNSYEFLPTPSSLSPFWFGLDCPVDGHRFGFVGSPFPIATTPRPLLRISPAS
jgi:hypothetical protein